MQDKFEFKVSFDYDAAIKALQAQEPHDHRDTNWSYRIGAAVEAGIKIEAVAPVINITAPQVTIEGGANIRKTTRVLTEDPQAICDVDTSEAWTPRHCIAYPTSAAKLLNHRLELLAKMPLSQTNVPEGWALVPKDIERAMMDLQTRHDVLKRWQTNAMIGMQDLTDKNHRLTTDYEHMMAARDQVAKSRDQLATELEGAHAERRRLSDEVDGLRVSLGVLQNDCDNRANQIETQKAVIEAANNEITRRRERVQVRIKEGDELRAENSRLRDKIRTLEEKHNRLQAGIELRVLREKVDAFEHQAVASGKRISELERNHQINEAVIKDRDESIKIQAKLIGDLEYKVATREKLNENLREFNTRAVAARKEAEDKLATVETQAANLAVEFSAGETIRDAQEAKIKQLLELNEAANIAYVEMKDKLALAGDAPAQVKVLSAAIEGLQEKLKNQRMELESKQRGMDRIVKERNEALTRRDELQTRLTTIAEALGRA